MLGATFRTALGVGRVVESPSGGCPIRGRAIRPCPPRRRERTARAAVHVFRTALPWCLGEVRRTLVPLRSCPMVCACPKFQDKLGSKSWRLTQVDGLAIARERIAREAEETTGFLDLGTLGLNDLPGELFALTHLQ